ncbi:hypothetical protein AQUCO_01600344v1 [Aquilegia coerulea]|uniref:Helicase ATP-binding domain-containing protein n=1 Tax=Aquilegia coerulea TaxID=218851 RepID=A0A2G5DR59_AQUCA|nr:hypothetical protein AQUCO_01600344v1 [Aquilegia coerulea]
MNQLQEKKDEYGDLLSVIQQYLDKKEIEARLNKTGFSKEGVEEKKLQLLNLDKFAGLKKGFLNTDEDFDLEFPKGSKAQLKNGYLEVNVPPLMRKPLDRDEVMVKVYEMPEWIQPAFEGITQLNRVQSKVYKTALFTNENILLCAPNGVGERDVAILTILNHIESRRRPDGGFDYGGYKIVYLAPMETCIAEVVRNLSSRLKQYYVDVSEISWDYKLTEQRIEGTQILVTTPEKWDVVSRKSGGHAYTQLVKLLIIDQIHLLHDRRGPQLEGIIARSVRMQTSKECIRLVGLSAPLPNYEDVALFLRVDLEKGLFYFDNSYRPCPLAQQYVRVTVRNPLQGFQLMNDLCYEKVMAVAGKRQILIYVHSMNEATQMARKIQDNACSSGNLGHFLKEDSASHKVLNNLAHLVKNIDLQDILPYGFAFHHTGMTTEDCRIVEDLFYDGHVQVLVTTINFAWGVNLPAHTVIIKGTDTYNPDNGSWTELSPLDVMKMVGCARKPQRDSYAEVIILTDVSKRMYYMAFINEKIPIESQFVSKLPYQLNSEIALGTVQNVKEACDWIAYTYLYVRMLRNPTLYGLAPKNPSNKIELRERVADMIQSSATILDKFNLVKYDKSSGNFQATELGRSFLRVCN